MRDLIGYSASRSYAKLVENSRSSNFEFEDSGGWVSIPVASSIFYTRSAGV